jgi:hypothetical protein
MQNYRGHSFLLKPFLILLLGLVLTALAGCGSDTPAPLSNHFQGGGISFDYPANWKDWDKQSLQRARAVFQTQGSELLALYRSPDNMAAVQLIKTKNSSAFDDFLRGKKAVADQVTQKGMQVGSQKIVKYEVTAASLPNSIKAVFGRAENSNGEMAVSCQFLINGFEYDLNFIYKNKKTFDKYDHYSQKIVQTIKAQK